MSVCSPLCRGFIYGGRNIHELLDIITVCVFKIDAEIWNAFLTFVHGAALLKNWKASFKNQKVLTRIGRSLPKAGRLLRKSAGFGRT